MKSTELDLYTDYLLSSFGAATATGLSQMVDGAVSHDKVTRFPPNVRLLVAPPEIVDNPQRSAIHDKKSIFQRV